MTSLSHRAARRVMTAGFAATTAAAIACVTLSSPSAGLVAASSYTATTTPIAAAAGWLTTQFEDASTALPSPTGDRFINAYTYGGTTYQYTSWGENADVVFGLAAAGYGSGAITKSMATLAQNANAYAGLSANSSSFSAGAAGKLAVAAEVAGDDPTSFGGYNLLSALKADECSASSCTAGSFQSLEDLDYSSTVSEALAIIAETRAGGSYSPSAAATSFFLSIQCPTGGFFYEPTACGAGSANLDSTSYGLMALEALGGHASQVAAAVTWLIGQQATDGSWGENVNSTGLAAAALQGAGQNVASARNYLLSQQISAGNAGAGAMKYNGSFAPTTAAAGTSYSVSATAQALPGLVDGGSLATLVSHASASIPLFAPTAAGVATATAGSSQTVTGAGFVAGEQVSAVLHSDPVTLGTATANASGAVSFTYTVPAGFSGAHTVTLTGLTSGLSATSALTVTAAPTNSGVEAIATEIAASASTTTAASTASSAVAAEELANTGTDGVKLVEFGVLAAVSLVAGAGMVMHARHRRAH